MDNDMKLRAMKRARSSGLILMAGAMYALWISLTGLYIPCPIRAVTGYLCPGCGISHCFMHLYRFEWKEAFMENQLVCILMPFACLYYVYRTWRYVKYGKEDYSKMEMILFTVLFYICIGFAVWRNS